MQRRTQIHILILERLMCGRIMNCVKECNLLYYTFPSTAIAQEIYSTCQISHVDAIQWETNMNQELFFCGVFIHLIIKNLFMLSVRISSYGCTREVWRALKKLELHSAIASCNSYASFVLSKLPACIHNSIYAR